MNIRSYINPKSTLCLLSLIAQLLPVARANETCVALSNGSDIVLGALEDKSLRIHPEKLNIGVLSHAMWPSYSDELEIIIFEARDKGISGIYGIDGLGVDAVTRLLFNGRLPSLSPDGRRLAYFDSTGSLLVHDLGSDAIVGSVDSIKRPSYWNRAVWMGDVKVTYIGQDNDVLTCNVESQERGELLFQNSYPTHSTSDKLLLVNRTGREIGHYEYASNKYKSIARSSFLSVGPSALPIEERNGVIFSQQTWGKAMLLSEAKSLFFFDYHSGRTTALVEDFPLFGGAIEPCEALAK